MTNQEVYSQVRKHLLKQNKQCRGTVKDEEGVKYTGCKYHFKKLRCAAGCLIPEQDYLPTMEGRIVEDVEFFRSKFSDNLELIDDLQKCHDLVQPSGWKEELARIAKKFELKAK